jgi:Protein of unknown function (DUF4199)
VVVHRGHNPVFPTKVQFTDSPQFRVIITFTAKQVIYMISNALFRTGMNYGSMSGLSLFLLFILLYFSGMNPLGGMSWLGAWIPLVFIVIATKTIRDQHQGGYISFGSAFRTGIITVFFSSLLFVLLVYIFGRIADGNLVEMYRDEILQGVNEARILLSDKIIDQVLEEAENVTMASIAKSDFTAKVIGGTVVSLVTSAFLMKREPIDFN